MRADPLAHPHSQSSGEPGPNTGQQLHTALRLIFAPALAERLAAAGGDPPDLRRVARLATRQYRLRQPRHPLQRGANGPGETRPLAPRLSLGARAALALAFHLALGLDAAALAGVFGCSLEEIERDLAQARQAVEPAAPRPCGRQPALARYRDPLDPATHLALYSHLRTCADCRAALEGYERVDARLLRESARSAERPERSRPIEAAPAWRLDALWLGSVAGALLLVAGLLATGLALAGRLGSSGAHAVPLLAPDAQAAPAGRLLEVDANRELMTRQLTTGRRAPLPSSTTLGEVDVPYVSPRSDLLAIWTRPTAQGFPTALAAVSPGWLKIDDLSGHQRWQQVFDSTDVAWTAAGWLGDDRFLLIAVPRARIDESQQDYRARIADQYRLVAVDVRDGAQQTIFQGGFALAQPSPDGSLIALTTGFDERSAGRSLELRAVEGAGLGPPLIDLEQQLASSVIWSPDSSRLIVNLLAAGDTAATPSASADVYVTGNGATPTSLATIDRAGRLRPLPHFPGDDQATPVMVSLDGGSLLYLSGPAGTGRTPRDLMRVSLDGGAPAKVLDTPVLGASTTTVVSPDRRSLLLAVVRPSYLAQDPLPGFQSDALMTELLRLGPDWRVDVLGSSPGATDTVLAWLPDAPAASAGAAPAASLGQTSAPQIVAELDDQFQLAANDSLDPTGRALLLDEGDRTVLWQRAADQSQLLPARLSDIAWLPGGEGLIGVLPVTEGGRQTSRIGLYTPNLVATLDQTYATQTFDPAQLGTDGDRRYARPLVAPDGDHVAFFVVDPSRQSIALWLTGWDTPARLIEQWTQPEGTDALAPQAEWLDHSTLLVTRLDDWQSGLPQRATLLRVALGDGGATTITPLAEVHSLGGDRGIALLDVALSPNGANLAYRVRHFNRIAPNSGEVDSVILASAGNLSRQIELARGGPGEGLAWSPDGSLLAAGLGGRIELFTLTDRDGRPLTPPGAQAADPVWLGDQLWFNMNGNAGRRVWRAQLR